MSETKIKRRSFLKGVLGAAVAPKLLAGEKAPAGPEVVPKGRGANPIFRGGDGQWDNVSTGTVSNPFSKETRLTAEMIRKYVDEKLEPNNGNYVIFTSLDGSRLLVNAGPFNPPTFTSISMKEYYKT
jgi:hypothetical protein